jgi:hypothetical protein
MKGWDAAVQVAMMNTRQLVIDQEKLEVMPIKHRTAFIMQKRVEELRGAHAGILKRDRANRW